jgi:prepilin peptidase dependent protein B
MTPLGRSHRARRHERQGRLRRQGQHGRLRQRGLSLVELMVGSALGLLLVGGATKLFIDSVDDTRRIVTEARVHQDLRAAADLVVRDLRRAGYWANAPLGAAAPLLPNPYAPVVSTDATVAAGAVTFAYSRDTNNTVEANEQFGFRLQSQALQALNGGAWQQVTDPGSVVITEFRVQPIDRVVPLGHHCSPACAPGSLGCPATHVRSFEVVLRGHLPHDATAVREVREATRLRNDQLLPVSCPAP